MASSRAKADDHRPAPGEWPQGDDDRDEQEHRHRRRFPLQPHLSAHPFVALGGPPPGGQGSRWLASFQSATTGVTWSRPRTNRDGDSSRARATARPEAPASRPSRTRRRWPWANSAPRPRRPGTVRSPARPGPPRPGRSRRAASLAEQVPTRPLAVDVHGPPSLVLAVVPLHQVGLVSGVVAEPGAPAGLPGARQRAAPDLGEGEGPQPARRRPRPGARPRPAGAHRSDRYAAPPSTTLSHRAAPGPTRIGPSWPIGNAASRCWPP